MIRLQWSIGQGFKADGSPLDRVQERKAQALRYIASIFGGCHSESGSGAWIDATGLLVTEPDLTITSVIDPSKIALADVASTKLADVFSQASVLLTIDDVTARYSDAKKEELVYA